MEALTGNESEVIEMVSEGLSLFGLSLFGLSTFCVHTYIVAAGPLTTSVAS